MTGIRAHISGMGIVCPLGNGIPETTDAIKKGLKAIRPLTLFPTPQTGPLPVGEVPGVIDTDEIPRTHQLARIAADQAMAGSEAPPDALVLGTTTGGMPTTERLLRDGIRDPELFRCHGAGSVALDLARRYGCTGPVVTVSTACSSGAVAIKVALEMLRKGIAKRVLAGGADALCRLTYYGFNSLQLIDPVGARPLDRDRRGMTLAEGAAMLLLTADRPEDAVAEVLGAGLSCDAHHPARPHPSGRGALEAMEAALRDAGVSISDIDYINLHGTGTPDNDLSEARALNALFPGGKPPLSSVKGAFGHSLAASGAVEAVVSAIGITSGLIPANTGCSLPDPELGLEPVTRPLEAPIDTVLSNSFGFGGNNAAVIIGGPGKSPAPAPETGMEPLSILGCACITGAGDTEATMACISEGRPCKGLPASGEISGGIPSRVLRRLKRLPRMTLSLALAAREDSGGTGAPSSVFFGTGWGALSETCDFLDRLFETGEQFPSPTDFVGSVHNAPAGQVAMQFQATGPNVTTTGGDYSFEQALMAAQLLAAEGGKGLFVIGADEYHPILSNLFDRSVRTDETPSDGGGAFYLKRGGLGSGPRIHLAFYGRGEDNPGGIPSLVGRLGGPDRINAAYGALMVGIPGGWRSKGEAQLEAFMSLSGFRHPAIDYRRITGEFASASAVAAVMAARLVMEAKIPGALFKGPTRRLHPQGALVLGLGESITAMEIAIR